MIWRYYYSEKTQGDEDSKSWSWRSGKVAILNKEIKKGT